MTRHQRVSQPKLDTGSYNGQYRPDRFLQNPENPSVNGNSNRHSMPRELEPVTNPGEFSKLQERYNGNKNGKYQYCHFYRKSRRV
jgi:hypothetical protein